MEMPVEQKRYKRSRQRERNLAVLKGTGTHPTAAWVYGQVKPDFPALSLGTVYRNLNILQEQGLIQVVRSSGNYDRFDAVTSPHYHFVCLNCGRVEDLDLPVEQDLEQRAALRTGRLISGHRLCFYGLCPDCAS